MTIATLRQQEPLALKAALIEAQQLLGKLKLVKQNAAGEFKQTHRFRALRKEIAQIKTLLHERGQK